MRGTAKSLMLASMLPLLGACGSFSLVQREPGSESLRGEQVTVKITSETSAAPPAGFRRGVELRNNEESLTAIVTAVLPTVIDYGLKFIRTSIQREAARYVTEYSSSTSNPRFYIDHNDYSRINFKEVEIERMVLVGGKMTRALYLKLAVQEDLDGSFFRFVPLQFEYNYPKTKLISGDRDADIDVYITIEAVSERMGDSDRWETHRESIEIRPIELRGVPIGAIWPAPAGGDDPSAPRTFAPLEALASDWIARPPRTRGYFEASSKKTPAFGLTPYTIRVKVKEFDNFHQRATAVAEYVETKHDDWKASLVDSILKALKMSPAKEDDSGVDDPT